MGDPRQSSLFLKDCTPWKGPTLEQFMKNCSPWEGPTLDLFHLLRSPTLLRRQSEGAAGWALGNQLRSAHCTHQPSAPHCSAESDCKSRAEIPPTLNLFCPKSCKTTTLSINLDQIPTDLAESPSNSSPSTGTAHHLMPGSSLPCHRSQSKG